MEQTIEIVMMKMYKKCDLKQALRISLGSCEGLT